MDDQTHAKYDAKSKSLRASLKQWEAAWASSHDGAKPARQDIKANAEIAQKYKDYNKVRDILSGKVPFEQHVGHHKTEANGQAERHGDEHRFERVENWRQDLELTTPKKNNVTAETPSRQRTGILEEGLMGTPAISRKLFSPPSVKTIGPTPQRDGKVLGLFDLLVERELGTPSRRKAGAAEHKGQSVMSPRKDVAATPSKRSAPVDETEESAKKLDRTPMSSSKRQRLDNFLTPLKPRQSNAAAGKTPTSVSRLQFETPAFLKRHQPPTIQEEDLFSVSVPSLKLPRKPLGRGLSEIVASLRKVEEDAHDDDEDALREMEADNSGPNRAGGTASQSLPKQPLKEKDSNIVGDSQTHRLPLGGFDDEGMYDSPVEAEEGKDQHGNPVRVFKKKGQKRTTRRVNMKPVRSKRPTQLPGDASSAAENDDDDEVVAPQTQAHGLNEPLPESAHDIDPGSGSEFEGDAATKKGQKAKSKKTSREAKRKTVTKVARKVNELAHANFHRLKLKNHGSKGGPGFNSRFRRRR